MKKLMTLLVLVGLIATTNAQTTATENTRRIATRGYAEKEVTPDIIYLSISLREYYENKDSKTKVPIDRLEKELFDAAMKHGVKKEDFTVQNIYSYSQTDTAKKSSELLQARQYRIKVTDLKNLNPMMEEVDSEGLQRMSVSDYDHSQKREIEKQLKTTAVKDARANADILAAADNEQVGKLIMINDNSNLNWNEIMPQTRTYALSAKAASADMAGGSAESLNLEVRPIKLTCNIDAVFEIQ